MDSQIASQTATQTEIKKTIMASIFLDEARKEKILEILKIATPQEQEKLLLILKSEKSAIGEILQQYVEAKGTEGIEALNMLLSQCERKLSSAEEKRSKKEEETETRNLLKKLDQL